MLVVIGIAILGQIVYFIYTVHDVTDSQLYYHRHKNYTHYYPLVVIAKNILITTFIFLKTTFGKPATMVCVAIAGAYIIAVFAGRPYRKFLDYGRFLAI